MRTEELASWSIQMNWGAVDYSDPRKQMLLIKQFEDVVGTPHVAEVDTKKLWLADFAIWTTHQCGENFDRDDPAVLECGINQVYPADNTTCIGTWTPNSLGLRDKVFPDDLDTCIAFEGGVCRPPNQMHPDDLTLIDDKDAAADSWCPVIEGWNNDKMRFCLGKWRELTGSDGRLVLKNETGTPAECEGEFHNDETVEVPIPYSVGPTMFAFDLFTHEITLDMIEETRAICDDDPEIHCWLSGETIDFAPTCFCHANLFALILFFDFRYTLQLLESVHRNIWHLLGNRGYIGERWFWYIFPFSRRKIDKRASALAWKGAGRKFDRVLAHCRHNHSFLGLCLWPLGNL
jgi:hypothetical protein